MTCRSVTPSAKCPHVARGGREAPWTQRKSAAGERKRASAPSARRLALSEALATLQAADPATGTGRRAGGWPSASRRDAIAYRCARPAWAASNPRRRRRASADPSPLSSLPRMIPREQPPSMHLKAILRHTSAGKGLVMAGTPRSRTACLTSSYPSISRRGSIKSLFVGSEA